MSSKIEISTDFSSWGIDSGAKSKIYFGKTLLYAIEDRSEYKIRIGDYSSVK